MRFDEVSSKKIFMAIGGYRGMVRSIKHTGIFIEFQGDLLRDFAMDMSGMS
jgi:hypothetical protein